MSAPQPTDFVRQLIREDIAAGRHQAPRLRWPPEPNGYLHLGHAKAIWLNFSCAAEFGGHCNLRFDDTNPAAESAEFVEAQQRDIRWLGYEWGARRYFASDYFPRLYEYACELIKRGKAFVCDLSSAQIEARRGTLSTGGQPSPFRARTPAENLALFAAMRAGEFAPGARTLRAKIDMASPHLPLRDPPLYRIVAAAHHRSGAAWPIYPLYDFAHCLCDAIEGITHSLCTLEFESRRPLYEWILEALELPPPRPRQIEFNPLRLTHTVLSKRWLRRLVEGGHVQGWDDPRLPTLAGLRRLGAPPEALRALMAAAGVTRRDEATVERARLDFEIRAHWNRHAPRRMGVLQPLKLVVENYPEGQSEQMELANNPEDAAAGVRRAPFARELWMERDDFAETPPNKKYFRLAPGREVRLRGAYLITCTGFSKNAAGEIVEVQCRYDPQSRGGVAPDGRRVRGALHWVSAQHALPAEARLYETLFAAADPLAVDEGAATDDAAVFARLLSRLNPNSLRRCAPCWLEPSCAEFQSGAVFQLERLGYFAVDPAGESAPRMVLNRTATLRDTWAKLSAPKPAAAAAKG